MPRFVDTSARGGGAAANERTREATNARARARARLLAGWLARLVVAVVRLGPDLHHHRQPPPAAAAAEVRDGVQPEPEIYTIYIYI